MIGTQYVTEYVSDISKHLQPLKTLEQANKAVAKAMGKDFIKVAKVIETNLIKLKDVKIMDKAGVEKTVKVVSDLGTKLRLVNGEFVQLGQSVDDTEKKNTRLTTTVKVLGKETSKLAREQAALIGKSSQLKTNFSNLGNVQQKFAKELKGVGSISKIVGKNITEVSGNTSKAGIVVKTANGKFVQLSETTKKLPGGIQKVTRSMKDVSGQFTKTAVSTAKMDKSTVSFAQNMKKLATRAATVIPIWLLLRGAMMAAMRLFKESIKFLVDWEYQMAQLAIVGKATKSQLEALSNSMLNLSTSLGISNKALGEAGKLYLQQGRAIKEIIPLMSATAKLSLLTGRTIVQSVEDMTAILKAYKMEASDAINVVDSITSTMLNHAITAGDLAAAYKQVASTASSLGVSLSALTGLITAIKTTTRDAGSKIGLSLRTMFTRISTSSAESLQRITQVSFYLDKMGRVTKSVTPNMRNLEDILFEMAGAFDKLTNAQQAQVSKLIGGIRRTNQVFALFNNFTEAIDAQTDALFGLGKADEAVRVLTDTTKLRIEQLSGAWSEFIDTVGDTGVFKDALNFLKSQIQGVTILLHPSRVLAVEVGKRYDEQIESLSRQKKLVDSILKSIARAKSLEEILARDGGNIELIQYQIQSLVKGINEAGEDFKIGVDAEIKDPKILIDSLKSQFDKLESLVVKARIEIPVQETLKEVAALGKIVSEGLEDATSKALSKWSKISKLSPLLSLVSVIDAKKNKKDLIEISNILKTMSLGAIIEDKEIDKLRQFTKTLANTEKQKALLGLIDQVVEKQTNVNGLLSGERKLREGLLKEAEQKNSLIETEFQLNHSLNQIRLKGTRTGRFEIDILEDQLEVLNKQKDSLSDELFKKRITIEQKIEKIYYKQGQNIKNIIIKHQLDQLKNAGALESKLLKQEELLNKQFKIEESIEDKIKRKLNTLERLTQESKRENQLSINYQLDILKLQGATNRQILEKRHILEESYNIDRNRIEQIKDEYKLQKEITKEKLEQGRVSGETLKLYKISQKYGPGVARESLEFVKGERKYPKDPWTEKGRDLKKALDEFFSSAVEARKAFDYFSKGAGKFISTKEKGAYPYYKPQELYQTKADVWKTREIAKPSISESVISKLKLPKIETKINTVKIELKELLTKENLTSQLVDAIAIALRPFIEETIENY